MKVILERDALHGLLASARGVVESRTTIPILSHVLLTAAAGALTIRSSNLDQEFSGSIGADVDQPGATTVPGRMLYDIIGKHAKGASVGLELNQGTGQLLVRSGRSRINLQTLPPADFPTLETGDLSHSFEIAFGEFSRLFGQAQMAISTEETRYYLNGVYLHTHEGDGGTVLRAVATDGHRLAMIEMPAPDGSGGMPGVIVPRPVVNEVMRWKFKDDVAIKISLSMAKIRFESPNGTLTSKLIDGTFPDYRRVIPSNNEKRLYVDVEAMASAVDRVSTISSERGRALKLSLTEGKLALSVNNPDSGSAIEEIDDVDYNSTPLDIGFNSGYLKEIFGQIKGDVALMKLNDPGSPALIQSRESSNELYVLMPLRI